jgi:hypothetical protein
MDLRGEFQSRPFCMGRIVKNVILLDVMNLTIYMGSSVWEGPAKQIVDL